MSRHSSSYSASFALGQLCPVHTQHHLLLVICLTQGVSYQLEEYWSSKMEIWYDISQKEAKSINHSFIGNIIIYFFIVIRLNLYCTNKPLYFRSACIYGQHVFGKKQIHVHEYELVETEITNFLSFFLIVTLFLDYIIVHSIASCHIHLSTFSYTLSRPSTSLSSTKSTSHFHVF